VWSGNAVDDVGVDVRVGENQGIFLFFQLENFVDDGGEALAPFPSVGAERVIRFECFSVFRRAAQQFVYTSIGSLGRL